MSAQPRDEARPAVVAHAYPPPQPQPHAHPYRTILATFAAWKFFLLALSLGSSLVGDTYDTSAGLFLLDGQLGNGNGTGNGSGFGEGKGTGLVAQLCSWDAIYYVSAARHGYRLEQEWAFGAGLPTVVRSLLKVLTSTDILGTSPPLSPTTNTLLPEALTSILIANTAHLLAALVLYRLGRTIWHNQTQSLLAALLHIFSPAGLFLSTPYSESSFALLAFTGYLFFALGCQASSPTRRDLSTIAAGAFFGLATAFRSNGILNGLPFAWEVLRNLPRLAQQPVDTLRRLAALGVGGVLVAAGWLGPQAVAYSRYCYGLGELQRPWCGGYLPSIFTFVQQHYWNVGLLRYWTLPNLPLFFLAAPMLTILTASALAHLKPDHTGTNSTTITTTRLQSLIHAAASAELLLALLAFTTYHVQIITRISSGCPVWHWWLAGRLVQGQEVGEGKVGRTKEGKDVSTATTTGRGTPIVMFMVIYACIQGVLFATFLPPA